MQQTDVLLIGSGISCLSAACILAQAGYGVTVLEKHYRAGGYLHGFKRFGCAFDTGAHYIGGMAPYGSFRILLEELKVYDPDLFRPLNQDAFDRFFFPDFSFAVPSNYQLFAFRLSEEFPQEASNIEFFLRLVSQVSQKLPTYSFDQSRSSQDILPYLSVTLKQVVDQLFTSSALKSVIYAYCGLHCVAPQDVPFGFHAVMLDSLMCGVSGFSGGGEALAQAFVRQIESLGGQVITRASVISVECRNGVISSVFTSRGHAFAPRWVIGGIHPKSLYELNGMTPPKSTTVNRLNRAAESIGLFAIYAKCNALPSELIDSNYYIFEESGDKPFSRLNPQQMRGINRPLGAFVSYNSGHEDPNGTQVSALSIHCPLPRNLVGNWEGSKFGRRPTEYQNFKKEFGRRLLALCGRHLPHLEQAAEQSTTSTSLTNEHFNGSKQGTAYGIYHDVEHTGLRAFGPRTHLKNLFLTGQNTLFPGLLASSLSGLRSLSCFHDVSGIFKRMRTKKEERSG